MTTETRNILVSTLASTDAIFYPWRPSKHRAAVAAAREEYHTLGVRWHSAASGAAAAGDGVRKRAEQVLTDGEAAGLWATATAEAKRSHLKLTAQGEAEARALCGLPGFAEAAKALARLRKLHADLRFDDAMISEVMLGIDYTKVKGYEVNIAILELEEQLMPSLVRRIIASNTTMAGHVWYRLISSDDLPVCTSTAKEVDKLRKAYFDRIRQVHGAMQEADRERGIGELPLPDGLDLSRPRTPRSI